MKKIKDNVTTKISIVWFVFSIFYWLVKATLDSMVLGKGKLVDQIFSPSVFEFEYRVLVILLFGFFCCFLTLFLKNFFSQVRFEQFKRSKRERRTKICWRAYRAVCDKTCTEVMIRDKANQVVHRFQVKKKRGSKKSK